jgi:hypothetical protein
MITADMVNAFAVLFVDTDDVFMTTDYVYHPTRTNVTKDIFSCCGRCQLVRPPAARIWITSQLTQTKRAPF